MFWKYLCILIFCVTPWLCRADDVDVLQNLITREIAKTYRYRIPENANQYHTKNRKPRDFGTYDFIVIGGGSGGCVVASKLSEVSNWKVLLLEAGKDETDFTDIPIMAGYTRRSEYNWEINGTKKTNCCLNSNGICSYQRGKGLGGSSITNFLIYSRGSKSDYDNWEALGNPGWSYNDVLPYFIKQENSQIIGDRRFHGTGGPLNVAYHRPISLNALAFLNASHQLGASIVDYNGRSQIGASLMQINTINGTRVSANKAFLKPARRRKNLRVSTESYVTKIVFSNTTRRVQSVIFLRNNIKYVANVNKEVILTAGVMGSSHLLMLSGIGPRRHLQSHKIPVVLNLPVGQSFADHISFRNFFVLTSRPEIFPTPRKSIQQYLNTGTGSLTISQNAECIWFFNTTNSPYSQIEVALSSSLNYANDFDREHVSLIRNFEDSWHQEPINASNIENRVIAFASVLHRPQSVGSVMLQSDNPFVYPLINFPCYDDPKNEDFEYFLRGIRAAERLLTTPAYKAINARLLIEKNCANHPIGSRAYWTCCLRRGTIMLSHGVGTCKMAPQNDGGVVNNRLKVYGIPNLRVADSSVIPFNMALHTNALTLVIGDRCADFIIEDYL